jgi:hypothetical protein
MKKYFLFLILAVSVLTCTTETFAQSGQLLKDQWHRECETFARLYQVQPRRWGMRATVYNDGTAALNGDYVLTYNRNSTNKNDNDNWLKVSDLNTAWGTGGGGGGFVTADNGLNANTATNVQFGGPLIKNTDITGGFRLRLGLTTDRLTEGGIYTSGLISLNSNNTAILNLQSGGVAGSSLFSSAFSNSTPNEAFPALTTVKDNDAGNTVTANNWFTSFYSGGAVANGFGSKNVVNLEVSDGNSYEVHNDQTILSDVTFGNENADYKKQLIIDGVLTDVYDIETVSGTPVHTFTGDVTITGACTGCGGGGSVTSVSGTTNRITSTGGATPVIDISASYVGQSSITTTGTLTSGATGVGFTVALGTSTITGSLPEANLTAKYIFDQNTVSTASGTVTLDMNSQLQRMFVGSATFASSKTIAFSNATNALVFNFQFEVTNVAGTLVFPSSVMMSDINWNAGTDTWTPPSIGLYECGGSYDGTNWKVKIIGPFN